MFLALVVEKLHINAHPSKNYIVILYQDYLLSALDVVTVKDIVLDCNLLDVQLNVLSVLRSSQRVRLYENADIGKLAFEIHWGRVGLCIFDLFHFLFFGSSVKGREHLSVEIGDQPQNRLLRIVNGQIVQFSVNQHFFSFFIELLQDLDIELEHVLLFF